MADSPTGYGAIIRDRRTSQDRTLRGVADTVGCTPAHMSKVEKEQRVPGVDLCCRISEELGIDKDMLLAKCGHVAPDVIDLITSDPELAGEVRRMAGAK